MLRKHIKNTMWHLKISPVLTAGISKKHSQGIYLLRTETYRMLLKALVTVMVHNMIQCAHGMLTFHIHFFTHGVTFHHRGVLDLV